MNEERFAVRTVRSGRVKIGGLVFAPSEQFLAYDGRLDGQRFAFGRYRRGRSYEPFVALWGTEDAFLYRGEDFEERMFEEPHCIDGKYSWTWWYAVTP